MGQKRLILHVGMGKTGTTSIQRALEINETNLKAQHVEYLGMWLDSINPAFRDWDGMASFMASSEEERLSACKRFLEVLDEKAANEGTETFILSNEWMSEFSRELAPFLNCLIEHHVEVTVLLYVRDPFTWLPSAYNQWSVKHKSNPGPLQSYLISARELALCYLYPLEWDERMPGRTIVRSYEAVGNVVADFAETLSLQIHANELREHVTETQEDMLLRAFFAASKDETYFPEVFEQAVGISAGRVPKLSDLLAEAFDYSATSEIMFDYEEVFSAYREKFGFDPRHMSSVSSPPTPDLETTRHRLVEVITGLALDQAQRIWSLESDVRALKAGLTVAESEITALRDKLLMATRARPLGLSGYIAKRWRMVKKGWRQL